MKKLVFLISFLLSFSVFAEDLSRGGEEPPDGLHTQPCNLRATKVKMFAAIRDIIDKDVNMVRGSITYNDTDNAFPAVGMINLDGDQAGHSSGTFLALKNKNGQVLRNKVVTSAHALFKQKKNEKDQVYISDELKVPIESIEFLLGQDVNNEDYNFKIKKIECPELWQDQCIVTLDKDVPGHIAPMEPVSNPDTYVQNADMFYNVGYPSWAVDENFNQIGRKGQRFYSQCKTAERWRGKHGEDYHFVGCNSAAGMSGGAFVASKKMSNGSWKDYYIGLVGGRGKKNQKNIADTFRYNEANSFNDVVITSENQSQFFASK